MRDAELTRRFARNLRRIRLAWNLSQDDLTDLYSTAHGFIGKLESGEQEPNLLTLIRLAGCLATDVDEFVTSVTPDRPRAFEPQFEERPLARPEMARIIAARVEDASGSRGLSLKGLAALAGVSVGALPGRRKDAIPRLSVAVDVAAALEIDLRRMTAGMVYLPALPRWLDPQAWWPWDQGATIGKAFVLTRDPLGPSTTATPEGTA